MGKVINLEGIRFGKLKVLSFAYCKNRKSYWNCVCDCGKNKIARSDSLKDGNLKSCGCLQYEHAIITHNKSNSKLYQVYYSMKNRCYNEKDKNFKYYGGKKVSVYTDWLNDFMLFYDWSIENGYIEGLTLDRINVNGNYEPSNCRWITQQNQANNTTRNRKYEINGEILNITQLSKKYNVNRNTLNYRLNQEWELELALGIK